MPLKQASTSQSIPSDKPAAAIAQTMPRIGPAFASSAITSGTLFLTSIYLPASTVNSLTYFAGTTALATGTAGWAALYDPSLALLGQSANDAAITWSASASKTFTLTAPAVIATAGWYYVGLLVAATTTPTVLGVAPGTLIGNAAPATRGNSTTGLTTTAPNPCAAPANGAAALYCYVS